KMVATKQNAADFIEKITAAAQAGSKHDYDQLLAYKKRHDPKADSVDLWDYRYLEREAKIDRFGYDSQAVRPYFEYSRVLKGILDLTSKMYGISYKPVSNAQVWHPDVAVYDVFSRDNVIVTIFFGFVSPVKLYKHIASYIFI